MVARPGERKPSETPYLHVRETEGALFPFAVEICGNAKALVRTRVNGAQRVLLRVFPLHGFEHLLRFREDLLGGPCVGPDVDDHRFALDTV